MAGVFGLRSLSDEIEVAPPELHYPTQVAAPYEFACEILGLVFFFTGLFLYSIGETS